MFLSYVYIYYISQFNRKNKIEEEDEINEKKQARFVVNYIINLKPLNSIIVLI